LSTDVHALEGMPYHDVYTHLNTDATDAIKHTEVSSTITKSNTTANSKGYSVKVQNVLTLLAHNSMVTAA
jgi:hypothetical protein